VGSPTRFQQRQRAGTELTHRVVPTGELGGTARVAQERDVHQVVESVGNIIHELVDVNDSVEV
jgi:hypothetical protein